MVNRLKAAVIKMFRNYWRTLVSQRKLKKLISFIIATTLVIKMRMVTIDTNNYAHTEIRDAKLYFVPNTDNYTSLAAVKFIEKASPAQPSKTVSSDSNSTKRQLRNTNIDIPETTSILKNIYNTFVRNPSFQQKMEDLERTKKAKLRIEKFKIMMIENLRNARKNDKIFSKSAATATKKKQKNKTAAKTITKKSVISHEIDQAEMSLNAPEIEKISNKISEVNERQQIYNEHKFGSMDFVIVIQIHKRKEHLKYLVESLSKAKGIESALVIFSHDFYDETMNEFVQNISTFRLMQTFFPHSIQLHPLRFPGRDPRDCAWNHKPKSKTKCLNEIWADTYGHYREASLTQMKHHWWWKFFRVFRDLRELQNFSGPVMFLEEDHYVSPDIFHVMNLLRQMDNATVYPNHIVYGLGNYQKLNWKAVTSVDAAVWNPSKFNMAFVLDRRAFNVISKCSKYFCFYDDYNFDWTIVGMTTSCAVDKLLMFSVKFSRAFHTGNCGVHTKSKNCNVNDSVRVIRKNLENNRSNLFPVKLTITSSSKTNKKNKRKVKYKPNGGFGDLRDIDLCLRIAGINETASLGL